MNPEIPPSSILEKELLKRNQQLEEKVARLEKENRILRDLRRLDLIKKYGPGSESLSLEQLELLELEPGVNGAEVEAEAQREPIRDVRSCPPNGAKLSRLCDDCDFE